MPELSFLILGLVGLWIGADFAVRGMANLAGYFKISGLFIGLTVASIGTSIPEMAISIRGGLDRLGGIETSGIVIGNKIGSALSQITLIMGIIALFGVLMIAKREWRREGAMLLASIGVFFLLALDGFISVFDGAILLLIYGFYFFNLIREERVYEKVKGRRPELHLLWDVAYLIGGIILVYFSAQAVIDSGLQLANLWGVKETFIGLLFVGLGTGLPELAISARALMKGATGLAVGNLIGSNIADILLSLGVGAVITGFVVEQGLLAFDVPILFLVTILMLYLFRTRMRLNKKEGIILIAAYFAYLAFKVYPYLV